MTKKKQIQKRSNIKQTSRKSTTQVGPQPSTSTARPRAKPIIESSSSPDESESDEYLPSSSRTQHRVELEPLTSAQESRLIADCAFYILVADQRKYAIKKADIVKNVFKEHRKHYKIILEKVVPYLQQVAGLRLHPLETHKGQYILVNEMKDSKNLAEIPKTEKMKLGFTMMILALIFMNEDFMTEPDLWKILRKVGIDPDTKHSVFGDVKKLLTQELVRQLYVEYKRENNDPPLFAFSWGPRAHLEVNKLEVMQLVCEYYGSNMVPEQWPNLYRQAVGSEQPVAESQE